MKGRAVALLRIARPFSKNNDTDIVPSLSRTEPRQAGETFGFDSKIDRVDPGDVARVGESPDGRQAISARMHSG